MPGLLQRHPILLPAAVMLVLAWHTPAWCFQLLVVHSYHPTMTWVQEVNEGIETVLGEHAVRYHYLDTKSNPQAGPAKATEAFKLFEKTKPDGVIAVDDDAQSLFVVPYLRNRVATPVIFCGVNAKPEQYGYPAANVTGVLERQHFAEAVAMMKQLVPSLKTVAFMMKQGTTADLIIQELEEEQNYLAEIVAFYTPATIEEALTMADRLKQRADAIYMTNLAGLQDRAGQTWDDETIFPLVARRFGKPLFSGSSYNVRLPGVLAAVAKTGQEQGGTAARMLLRAMTGTPLAEMPITRNQYGKRMINITVMKQFGLSPDPIVLRGVELVTTAP